MTIRLEARAPAPRVLARRRQLTVRGLRGVFGIVGLLVLLEWVSRSGLVNPKFLPPFSEVVVKLAQLLVTADFQLAILSTLATWAFGLLISMLIAIPVGILLGLSEVTYQISRPILELIRPMPAVALIPLVILVVGQGLEMKLILAVYAAAWPILFNTIYGVHGTDPKTKEMAKSFRIGRAETIARIVIPSAAPLIGTGVRISSSVVLIVIVTVELIAGGATGLGSFIGQMRSLGDQVDAVYAGILVTGILGLGINLLLGWLERKLFAWDMAGGTE